MPGSAFTSGGYNGTVTTASSSVLAGQPAFVLDSPNHQGPEYVASVARLGILNAGNTVAVRFVSSGDATRSGGLVPNWEIASFLLTVEAAPVTCTPPSGSTFPLGDTLVTCFTTDTTSNSAACTFTLTVQEAPDCLLVWKFEEPSGLTVLDDSGSGNNGRLVNGPTRTTGIAPANCGGRLLTPAYVCFSGKPGQNPEAWVIVSAPWFVKLIVWGPVPGTTSFHVG